MFIFPSQMSSVFSTNKRIGISVVILSGGKYKIKSSVYIELWSRFSNLLYTRLN